MQLLDAAMARYSPPGSFPAVRVGGRH
jgi:hypothetical protein